jgi:glycosyltransferase involved in cell wall biosynthesis
LRILIINYEFPPIGGGGGIFCYQLAKELVKNGHRVDYITSNYKNLPSYDSIAGINVLRVPVIGREEINVSTPMSLVTFLISCLSIGGVLCKYNTYDIINSHFVLPSALCGTILSRIFKIPHVISLHGGDIYDPSKMLSPHRIIFLRYIIRLLLNSCDCIVAQSTNTKNNIIKYYKPNKIVSIIPLGITKPDFPEISREKLGLSKKDILLISVGRLVKRKGFDYMIKALSKISHKNIKYLIIGNGPEYKNLKRLSKNLGEVMFLGQVSEEKKFQYLSISDFYILPSLHEGFGICLLEAMLCGLPIVATNNGGQTDFLVDGRNALLVSTKDVDGLAKAIDKLIENKALSKKMSKINSVEVKEFEINKIVRRYEDLYIQITKLRKNRYK